MLHRLSFWMALFVFAAAGASRAQTPAAPASPAAATAMPPGQIVAAKVTGVVSMVLDGATTPLKNGDKVQQKATVVTANDSSVILVFSNGATTQLGADTSLVIEEFLQDPFKDDVNVGQLEAEPTRSHTRLHLTKGELVGKVVKLHHDQGSTFNVQTPVGAAGIRGTTFRIVFRPTGTGQAFALFSLSTAEGNVNFQQNGQGGQGGAPGQPGQGPAQGEPQGQGGAGGQPGTPGGGGTTPAGGGVAVTGGQEVVVTISVNVNPTTGQVTLASAPTITSTQPISVETSALITQQAQAAVVAASTTTFTSTGSSSSTTTGSTTTTTETEKKDETKTEEKKTETPQENSQSTSGDGSSSGSSGGTTSGGSSSGTSSGSTTGSTGSSSSNNSSTSEASPSSNTSSSNSNNSGSNLANQAKAIVQNASPGVTQPTPPLTPGAGK